MTRNGATKSRILKIMSHKEKTLSDLSRELKLAPSTVSQHLQELRDMGAVQEVENEHIKKWKYYRLNTGFNSSSLANEESIPDRIRHSVPYRPFLYSVMIIALAVGAYAAIFLLGSNVQKSSIVQISLTDPPIVPNGTDALYINYSSVSVLAASNGTAEWIQSNSSGTVNLMSLVNVSQVIAGVEVPHSLRLYRVRFNITSASITVNGTMHQVYVLGRHVTAVVNSTAAVNASSELLVDLSPVVREIESGNSTLFIMIPRANAALESAGRVRLTRGGWIDIGYVEKMDGRQMAIYRRLESSIGKANSSINASLINGSIGGT